MPLPRPSSPRVVWNDLKQFWSGRPRHQWLAFGAACLIPIGIVGAFYLDAKTNIQPGPQLILIESWPLNRSPEEIVAKQQRDLAERRRRDAAHQQTFKDIDNGLSRYGF